MKDESILERLLDQWEAMQDSDERTSPDTLCADHPHLLPEFLECIKNLDAFEQRIAGPDTVWSPNNEEGVSQLNTNSELSSADSRVIGNYKLIRVVGEGGMGVVWLAEQVRPVRRRVALKLIKGTVANKQILGRFEAERQALAMMDHPNIARIFDAGSTDDGKPYFVMEFVDGVSLTQYCDQQKLSISARLQLFVSVCRAIQHAHQKGIIHRDLKPSNIQVITQDGEPVPKVIDFGLAKALQPTTRLTDETMSTQFGQLVGTVLYMSPEQADLDQLDIDTRSDIFAPGVILYKLLAGCTPLDELVMREQSILKVLAAIRETEPMPPSIRLTKGNDLVSVAQHRSVDPRQLCRSLSRELDWIVMKALEKDRSRRYETASSLAADVENYLTDGLVTARPPSTIYRMRKFARKHRVAAIAASLVSLSLLGGIAGTSLAMARAFDAEELAQRRFEEAESQRTAAERNLDYATKGNEILSSVFKGLDPNADYSTVAELRNALMDNLKDAIEELEGSAIGSELVVAKMQNTLGVSLLGLGGYVEAAKVLESSNAALARELGPAHTDTISSTVNLAAAHHFSGEFEKAIRLLEQVYETSRQTHGADEEPTLTALNNLAGAYVSAGQFGRALPLLEDVVERRETTLGVEHADTLSSMNNLALCYKELGRLDDAVSLYRRTKGLLEKKLGFEHPETLTCMNNLATAYEAAGKSELAIAIGKETIEKRKKVLGPSHPNTLDSMNAVAIALRSTGQLSEAIELYNKTMEMRLETLGPEHPDTIDSINNLACGYFDAGRLSEAIPLFEQAVELRRKVLGPDHPRTLEGICNLGVAFASAQNSTLAAEKLSEFVSAKRKTYGEPDLHFTNLLEGLAGILINCQALPAAEEMLRESLGIREGLQPHAWSTFNTMSRLGGVLLNQEKPMMAEPYLVQALEGMLSKTSTPPEFASSIPIAIQRLTGLYVMLDRTSRAAEQFSEFAAAKRKTYDTPDLEFAHLLETLASNLVRCQESSAGEQMFREALGIRESLQPDAWATHGSKSWVGGLLMRREEPLLAEPLLVRALEGMQSQASTPPEFASTIPETLQRLIDLYEMLDQPAKAAKYTEMKEKYTVSQPDDRAATTSP